MAKHAAYLVTVGTQPGVYDTWDEASARVLGVPGSVYRGCRFRWEAEEAFQKAQVEGRTQVVRVDGRPAPAPARALAAPTAPAPAAAAHAQTYQDTVPTPPATPPHSLQSLSYAGSPPRAYSTASGSTGVTIYQPDFQGSLPATRPAHARHVSRSQSERVIGSSHISSSAVSHNGSDRSNAHSRSAHAAHTNDLGLERGARLPKVSRSQSERAPDAPRIPPRSLAGSASGSEPRTSSSPTTGVTHVEPSLSSEHVRSPPLFAHISELSSPDHSSRVLRTRPDHSERILHIARALASSPEVPEFESEGSTSSSPRTNVTCREPSVFSSPHSSSSPRSPPYPDSEISPRGGVFGLGHTFSSMSLSSPSPSPTPRSKPVSRSQSERALGSPASAPAPVSRSQSERALGGSASSASANRHSTQYTSTKRLPQKTSSPAPSSISGGGRIVQSQNKPPHAHAQAQAQTTPLTPVPHLPPPARQPPETHSHTHARSRSEQSVGVQTTPPTTPRAAGSPSRTHRMHSRSAICDCSICPCCDRPCCDRRIPPRSRRFRVFQLLARLRICGRQRRRLARSDRGAAGPKQPRADPARAPRERRV
ncbi:hypothetical protein B0H21DRAFT_294408 [Amylocystis lapponica]|nr:hypothetical protein B0H21DRAFT_294408 [Amylocystis lapponica]